MEITPELIAKKLNAAADLLEKKGWTKGEMARNAKGKPCAVGSRLAVCFCLYGAFYRVSSDYMLRQHMDKAVEKVIGTEDIITWNDTRRSAKPVIAALRGAAKQVLTNGV